MIVWIDGRLGSGAASLDVAGPAFRCGMGVFETILLRGHALPRFERHLERLRGSLSALRIRHALPGDAELRAAVMEVARANGLAGETARVNLFCYQDAPGGEASLCVAAAPYEIDPEAACELAVYPEAHVSHLCRHKTMANLHQRLAWEHARAAGAHDALLTDFQGRVLEAACAALVFSDGHGFYVPSSPHRLPSLTLEAASRHLHIEEAEITLAALPGFRHAYWLNSLGGIRPVTRIDAARFEPDWETCRPLLRELLGLDL